MFNGYYEYSYEDFLANPSVYRFQFPRDIMRRVSGCLFGYSLEIGKTDMPMAFQQAAKIEIDKADSMLTKRAGKETSDSVRIVDDGNGNRIAPLDEEVVIYAINRSAERQTDELKDWVRNNPEDEAEMRGELDRIEAERRKMLESFHYVYGPYNQEKWKFAYKINRPYKDPECADPDDYLREEVTERTLLDTDMEMKKLKKEKELQNERGFEEEDTFDEVSRIMMGSPLLAEFHDMAADALTGASRTSEPPQSDAPVKEWKPKDEKEPVKQKTVDAPNKDDDGEH